MARAGGREPSSRRPLFRNLARPSDFTLRVAAPPPLVTERAGTAVKMARARGGGTLLARITCTHPARRAYVPTHALRIGTTCEFGLGVPSQPNTTQCVLGVRCDALAPFLPPPPHATHLSIIVSAGLAHVLLKEKLHPLGMLGCVLCIVGSVAIVLHAPAERHVESVQQLWALAMEPGE